MGIVIIMDKTYNEYLTKGILDESIKSTEVDGVRCYVVRRPKMDSEAVMGYTNLSGLIVERTPTDIAIKD
jgi:hypothetical protein